MSAGIVELVSSMVILASDGDASGWLLLAGPLAGGGLYFLLYRFYRNIDKSHSFEREAKIEARPVTGSDAKVDEVRGTQRSSISGNNVRQFRHRVQRVR